MRSDFEVLRREEGGDLLRSINGTGVEGGAGHVIEIKDITKEMFLALPHAVFLPHVYASALECQVDTWRYLRHCWATGSSKGCKKPKLFACKMDTASCYPWAARCVELGHVLVTPDLVSK